MNPLVWVWQLPQHLVSLFLLLIWKPSKIAKRVRGNAKVFYVTRHINHGLCLGEYRFIPPRLIDRTTTHGHEWGHTVQSRIFGFLYFPVIGLSSLYLKLNVRILKKGDEWYYAQPFEKWADSIGGVVREFNI